MNQTSQVVMPWGRHRGRPVSAVDSSYLDWVLRECRNAAPALRSAAQAELDRRAAMRRLPSSTPKSTAKLTPITSTTAMPHQTCTPDVSTATKDLPPLVDHVGIMLLLADLLVARVCIVARGEGAIHVFGGLTPALRDRLARQHANIDRLVAWVRWSAPDHRLRVTNASQLMARLRSAGTTITALPDGTVAVSPRSTIDPLAALTTRARSEVWFRAAVGIPDLADEPVGASAHPNVTAGILRYCLRRADQAATRGATVLARRWNEYAAAVAEIRNGWSGRSARLLPLVSFLRRQAAALAKRDKNQAAAKWSNWAQSLGA